MLRRIVVCSALLAASWFAFAPAPAKADSFSFGYSSGDYRRHPGYGPRHYHGYNHYHRPPPRYYGSYYYAPPPVIYAPPPPPVVYVPPPVVYAPPMISAAPASPVYQAPNGQYCREYQGGVSVGGHPQRGYGTACLMPDGAWRVVN
jgi:hypothetical protein